MTHRRSLAVDLFKLAAAFRMAMIHLSPSTPAADAMGHYLQLAGMPFFILIAIYFFIKKMHHLDSFAFSDLGKDRILVPYIVWTLLYVLMLWLKMHLTGEPFSLDWAAVIFFGGSALQLYFLPLLLLFQAQALAIILMLRKGRHFWIGIGVGIGALSFSYLGAHGGYFGFGDALPRGLIYIATAYLLSRMQSQKTGRRINILSGGLVLIFLGITAVLGHMPFSMGILQGPIIAYGICSLALNWHFYTDIAFVRNLLTCSYGIFLAHFGVLEGFEFLAEQSGFQLAPYTVASKLTVTCITCLTCIFLVQVARLHWLSAYLLFGESQGEPVRITPRLKSGLIRISSSIPLRWRPAYWSRIKSSIPPANSSA